DLDDRFRSLLVAAPVEDGVQPQEVLHADTRPRWDALIPPILGPVHEPLMPSRCEKKAGGLLVPKELERPLHPLACPLKVRPVKGGFVKIEEGLHPKGVIFEVAWDLRRPLLEAAQQSISIDQAFLDERGGPLGVSGVPVV